MIPLILLSAALAIPGFPLSEELAVGIGLVALLVIVAAAVAIFILCGAKNAPYDFIDKEPFETEYGVSGMVRERQKAFRGAYSLCNIIGACLCVLSPVPLFAGMATGMEFFMVVMLAATMVLAGIGSAFFIVAGVRWASMQKLLKEGEYSPLGKRESRVKETVGTIYWLSVTAIYLGWSFLGGTDNRSIWNTTWVVWPIAGILFAVVMSLCNLLLDRDQHRDP